MDKLALRVAMWGKAAVRTCVRILTVYQVLDAPDSHLCHQWKIPAQRFAKGISYREIAFPSLFSIMHAQHAADFDKMLERRSW
jgi:hypothetical protein